MTRFIGFNIATNIIFPYLLPWQQFGYFQITIGFLSWITFYCKHFLKFSLWSNLQLWFYVLSFTNNNNNIEYESKEVINQASKSVPLPQILYVPFSSCPQSFPPSGSFIMSQIFSSSGQSIGVSASTSDYIAQSEIKIIITKDIQLWNSPLKLEGEGFCFNKKRKMKKKKKNVFCCARKGMWKSIKRATRKEIMSIPRVPQMFQSIPGNPVFHALPRLSSRGSSHIYAPGKLVEQIFT